MRKNTFSRTLSFILIMVLCVSGSVPAVDVQAASALTDPVSEICKQDEVMRVLEAENEEENMEEPEDFSWMEKLNEESEEETKETKTEQDSVSSGADAYGSGEAFGHAEFGDGSVLLNSPDAVFSEGETTGKIEENGEDASEELFGAGEETGQNAEAEFADGSKTEEGKTDANALGDEELGESEAVLHLEEGEDFVTELNILLYKAKDLATDEHPYKVIIPPGNYEMSGTVCTYSNIHLYAVGAVIKKVSEKKQILLRLGNSEVSEGGYDGYRNITIEGGTWDCNYASCTNKEEPGGFVGFRIGHATNVTIKNVTFLNNLKSHFLELGGVKHALVTGCTFEGYWTPHETTGQECIQIDVCLDEIFPRYQPFDGTVTTDVVIENNVFQNVFSGAGSHSMVFDRPYTNIVIRNNVFRNVKKGAVGLLNCKDSTVANNVMQNVGAGVTVTSMRGTHSHVLEGQTATAKQNQAPQNVLVSNNSITLAQPCKIAGALWRGYGIQIAGQNVTKSYYGTPVGYYFIRGVTASGNQISGPGNGIRLDRTGSCIISNNNISLTRPAEFTNFGIYLGGSLNNRITYNVVKNAGNIGIYTYTTSAYRYASTGNKILNNQVSGCASDGIRIASGSDKTVLQKNTCTGNGRNGIYVDKSLVNYLIYNNVTGNGAKGIYCSNSTIKVQKKNVAKGNASEYAFGFYKCKGQVQSVKKTVLPVLKKGAKKITGTAYGGTKVYIYETKTNTRLAIAKVAGKWKFSASVKALKKGTVLTLKTADKYSNIVIEQTKVV